MYFCSEEELDELLICRIVRQPQTFAKIRLLEIENLTEFRQKFLFLVQTFINRALEQIQSIRLCTHVVMSHSALFRQCLNL